MRSYIEAQERHHAKYSFDSEYMALLDKSGVERSPEYTFG